MLGVGDSVADEVLQEDLQDAAGFLGDEAGDPLDTDPPGQVPRRMAGLVIPWTYLLTPPLPSIRTVSFFSATWLRLQLTHLCCTPIQDQLTSLSSQTHRCTLLHTQL